MAYATVSEVIQRMGHPTTTSADLEAKVADALEAATTAIDSDTGRFFGTLTASRAFGADSPSGVLYVPDLVSVSALKIDDDNDGVYESTVPASGFELDTWHTTVGWPFEMVRLLSRGWPCGGRRRRVEISGVWGWAAVPAPINQACSLLAARLSQRASSALFGMQFGDTGAGYVRSQDPDYQHLIGPYTKIGIA